MAPKLCFQLGTAGLSDAIGKHKQIQGQCSGENRTGGPGADLLTSLLLILLLEEKQGLESSRLGKPLDIGAQSRIGLCPEPHGFTERILLC